MIGGSLTSVLVLLTSCHLFTVLPGAHAADASSKQRKPHRVAIIGAGAAGSSAAYWLARASNRSKEVELEIEVFEREGYIGGRSTVVFPHNSKAFQPVELGASIFVTANKNLIRAAQEFGLTLTAPGGELGGLEFGMGRVFGFSQADDARLVARYGLDSITRTQDLTQDMLNHYLELYNTTTPDWKDVARISAFLNLTRLTSQTTEAYLRSQGVGEKYIVEMVEGDTRANYAQNTDKIHALEGLVSEAVTGASSVAGGNFQIFHQFVQRSGARVHLNTEVKSLTKLSKQWLLTTSNGTPYLFDSVILAAPFHLSNITTPHAFHTPIPPQPYIHLHVTLLTTSSTPKSSYFHLKNTSAPVTVLTTSEGVTHGGPNPEFNSLTYQGPLSAPFRGREEHVVKLFSEQEVGDEWLRSVFGEVTWVYRKQWDSYPILPPTTSFPPVVPDENLYYVNSFEPFISTMETETVSSSNAVRLLLANVFDQRVISCEVATTRSTDGEIMKGWDC
ncbi:hypothetical protein M422DRAFT_232724 [Sphaerobolus stellatus SS14]|uniref:Prenylcysteine lyase domain-containing protein n=1 Tax=Sphaerobolus stellatus (strain SS14) TaxID=990650 RepID=A0A0C9VEE6_SPHS4|nr:hypothetical protein M422DRAFT_232724 [Sphaerobolus stellatus SS14]